MEDWLVDEDYWQAAERCKWVDIVVVVGRRGGGGGGGVGGEGEVDYS